MCGCAIHGMNHTGVGIAERHRVDAPAERVVFPVADVSRFVVSFGASSSGKTQVFGTCIRRFESSRPSFLLSYPAPQCLDQ